MITPPADIRIALMAEPVDFRKGVPDSHGWSTIPRRSTYSAATFPSSAPSALTV